MLISTHEKSTSRGAISTTCRVRPMSAKWTFMVYVAGYNQPLVVRRQGPRRDAPGRLERARCKIAVFVKRLPEQQAAHRIIVGKDGKDEERENLGATSTPAPRRRCSTSSAGRSARRRPSATRSMHLEPRLGLGPAGLRRALRARQGRGRDAARAGPARRLPARPQPLPPDARDRADAARRAGRGRSPPTTAPATRSTRSSSARCWRRRTSCSAARSTCSGMDACLMSCLEVAYESADDVRAVVSSEELEPGDGWPYDKILADLRSNPGDGRRRASAASSSSATSSPTRPRRSCGR